MRSAPFVRAAVLLAAALLLGGAMTAAPATSTPVPVPDRVTTAASMSAPCIPRCWVAVAYNKSTGRSGWTQAGRWGGKQGAMTSAQNHCKNRDVNAGHPGACVWPGKRNAFKQNGCVAIARLIRNGNIVQWTVGKGYGPKKAMREAKRRLDGSGNRVAGYACSPRRF